MGLERLEFSNPFLRMLDNRSTTPEIILRHGHIAITNYKLGDNPDFEKLLSVWNKMYWKYDQVSGYYIEELKEFRVGRGFSLNKLKRLFPRHKMRVENIAYPSEKVKYNLTTPPRSDFQRVALTFMAGQSPYTKNQSFTQQLINADTGEGKAQPDDTMIPTPTGYKRLDKLKVGDKVFNMHGKPVSVLDIYPQKGLQETYELTFKDGRTTRCNPEHLWRITDKSGEIKVLPLSAFIDEYDAYSVPIPGPIECGETLCCDRVQLARSLGLLVYVSDADVKVIKPVPGEALDIIDIRKVEPTMQRCIYIDDPDHVYLTENFIPTHNTYCGVAISAYFQARVVIVCPISKLLGQWKESYTNFTDLEEKDIMIVKGSKACDKIREGRCRDKTVFIFTSDTIMSYINNRGNRAAIEMMAQTGAFVKIVDEVHKDMKIVAAIEAVCNFTMNYYMSASPMRSDEKENFIFDLLYANVPKFGAEFKKQEEKHINIIVKQYQFLPNEEQIREMYRPKLGLNTKAYERVLITAMERQRDDFDRSVGTMLQWSKDLVKKGNKILILCQTVAGTEYMEALAEKVFPKKCSHYYATGMNKTQKEAALEAKVICATASSMGTGADIKGIQHVINICTYSNPIDASQLPGRARKLDDGTPVVYVELVNMGYRKTVNQYMARRQYLNNKAANGKIMVIR